MDTPGPYPRSSFQWLQPPRIVEGLYRWRAFDLLGPLARSLAGSFIPWPTVDGQPMIKPPVFDEYHAALDALIQKGATDEALPWSVATKTPEVITSWESAGVSFSLPGPCGGGGRFYDDIHVGWAGSVRHGLQIPMLRMERILCALFGQTWQAGHCLATGVRSDLGAWVRPTSEDEGPLKHRYTNAGYLAVEVFRSPRANASLNAAVMHILRVRDHRRKFEFVIEAQPALNNYRPRICVRIPRSHDAECREDTAAWFLLFVLLPATGLSFSTVARGAQQHGPREWSDLGLIIKKATASIWMDWCAIDPQALSTGTAAQSDYERLVRIILKEAMALTSYEAYLAEVRKIPPVGNAPLGGFQWVTPPPNPPAVKPPPPPSDSSSPEEPSAEEQERRARIRARSVLNKMAIPDRDYNMVLRALRQRIQAAQPDEPLWQVHIPEASQVLWALRNEASSWLGYYYFYYYYYYILVNYVLYPL